MSQKQDSKTQVLLMGQTPPPWHGQAVATQILFEHDWPAFEVHRLRMEFSEEMLDVGRFQWKKVRHLFNLISEARAFFAEHPDAILFYPPASAKWIPFLRDVLFLRAVRKRAAATVFIFHASGLPVFVQQNWLRRLLSRMAYQQPEVSLEVAKEKLPPHAVFEAKTSRWCPCAIDVPEIERSSDSDETNFKILFVGSLQEGKGVLELIRTAATMRRKGFTGCSFLVVGRWFSEDFKREATELCRSEKVEGLVHFLGEKTGEEKWQLYADVDVFFFPTHYASEATPIVIMEALGMGLPIVATAWAGIPAMLDGCATSRLLPIKSPEAYASALMEYKQSGTDRTELAEQSQAFYRDRFLPARFIDRVEAAFVEAAKLAAGDGQQQEAPLRILAYLADQNPKLGRSLGISRMTEVVLGTIGERPDVALGTVVSKSSVESPPSASTVLTVPWSTRGNLMRVFTDNFHPLFTFPGQKPNVWYFPKGFMPRLHKGCSPAVATIHDTIIQYYQDKYPKWRLELEYSYWAGMLRHTLTHAAAVMTVSEHAKTQIEDFIERHRLPQREIFVTYEPCLYEDMPQPETTAKADYVLHLGSHEPHKRTAWLIKLWAGFHEAYPERDLPKLHVVGKVPEEVGDLVKSSRVIVYLPFLEDRALISQFTAARALLFPSEVEGFGLPAIEAYFLGTPVCYTRDTSIDEVLSIATTKGGFDLDEPESLLRSLDEVLAMDSEEIHKCGLILRETYHSSKVVESMMAVFEKVSGLEDRGASVDRELSSMGSE